MSGEKNTLAVYCAVQISIKIACCAADFFTCVILNGINTEIFKIFFYIFANKSFIKRRTVERHKLFKILQNSF